MTVEFSCPECDKVYTLPANLAGRMARCKQCQTVMIVPGAIAPVYEPPARPIESRPPSVRKGPVKPRVEEPPPTHLYGIEDDAPLPPRLDEVGSPAIQRTRKSTRKSRPFWDNLPQPSFGLGVLAWMVLMVGLVGLSFQIEDGAYKCGQLICWMGIVLAAAGNLWFFATAFQESFTRGIMVLFVPLYHIYHLVDSWSATRRPFYMMVAGAVSVIIGAILFGLAGSDVGERSVLAVPGSAASQKVVIDEEELPLRPPEIAEDTPVDQAVLQWERFVEALKNDDRIGRLVTRKKKAMASAHGSDKIVVVTVDYVMDGKRFDEVARALRPFAGPNPGDFFAYPSMSTLPPSVAMRNPHAKRNVNLQMTVLLAPVHDPQVIVRSNPVGRAFSANKSSRYILIATSTEHIPAQLRSLQDTAAKGEQLADGSPIGDPMAAPERPETLPTTGDLVLPYPRVNGNRNTIYPVSTSRYVAIGSNLAPVDSRESWDLIQRRRIGVIVGQVPLYNRITLSPDGRTMAGVARNQLSVEIWSFETGKLVRQIDVNTTVNLVEYAGPDRILISTPFQKTYYLTDIASGRGIKTIVSPVSIDTESLAFNPDLKSLAVAASFEKSAGVYSLETAKLIQNWAVPPAQKFSPLTCKGMVYSADGTELAGLFEDFQYRRYMVWGQDGRLIANALVPMNGSNAVAKPLLYQGRPLEWLPDKSGWMVYGRAIVAKETGRLAWSIPSSPDDSKNEPRRILDNGELLTVGGPVVNPILRGVRLPLEEIATAIQSGESTPEPSRSESIDPFRSDKAKPAPRMDRPEIFVIPRPGSNNSSRPR